MALLKTATLLAAALAILVAPGCYSPDVKDCKVTCTTGDSCADGQTCTNGYCVDEGADTTCGPRDMLVDASMPPAMATVMIQIMGHGHVMFGATNVCDTEATTLLPSSGKCNVMVPENVAVHATAVPAEDMSVQGWTGVCLSAAPTCDFTPTIPAVTMGAHFH